MKKTFYITTPIYYPSGDLHIGHVYTTTLAWVIKNYKTLCGYDAKFLTGSDEHGQKIEQKAAEANLEPQKYVDLQNQKFVQLWNLLDIKYDYYSRTTNDFHQKAIQKQFTELLKKGDIYKGQYVGWYSIPDEEFLTPKQAVEKDGKLFHPTSGHELTQITEESYFFNMSKYQNWIRSYIEKNPNFIVPPKIVNELITNFIDKGIEDLSISRSSFTWGVPINEDPKHVMYVWLDALNNYITALGYNSKDDSDFLKYWQNGDEIVHFVGKEIARFHCIYWPIILHASGIKLPTTILSHGWIVTPSGKMSKSKGNVIDPIQLVNKYGNEEVKYFFASKIAIGQDGIFDEEILKNTINSELANKYGNLVSRTLAMIAQNFTEPVKFSEKIVDVDQEILKAISQSVSDFKNEMDVFNTQKGLMVAIELAEKLNKYIDVTQPWTLKNDKARLEVVLNTLLNGIYAVSTYLSVVVPNKTNQVLEAFAFKNYDLKLISEFKKFNQIRTKEVGVLFERVK